MLKYELSVADDSKGVIKVSGTQMLETHGPRLNNTAMEKASVVYAPDKRLVLSVQPPMPKIKVRFVYV